MENRVSEKEELWSHFKWKIGRAGKLLVGFLEVGGVRGFI